MLIEICDQVITEQILNKINDTNLLFFLIDKMTDKSCHVQAYQFW